MRIIDSIEPGVNDPINVHGLAMFNKQTSDTKKGYFNWIESHFGTRGAPCIRWNIALLIIVMVLNSDLLFSGWSNESDLSLWRKDF